MTQAEIWTTLKVLDWTREFLASRGVENARLEAEWLLCAATGLDRVGLYLNFEKPLHDEELAAYRVMVARRGRREPLQHILGTQEFYGLEFEVSPDVLIPRHDTETLVSEALRRMPDARSVLDIGTGSGCIILSLAQELGKGIFVGIDKSAEALSLARENAVLTGLDQRVLFAESDGCGEFDAASVDVLVSNPPYIPSRVVDGLARHIREHEPRMALDGGADGLDVYRALLLDAVMVLKIGGGVFFEIGDEQGPAMRDMLNEFGFADVAIIKDYAGKDRFATGVQSV